MCLCKGDKERAVAVSPGLVSGGESGRAVWAERTVRHA